MIHSLEYDNSFHLALLTPDFKLPTKKARSVLPQKLGQSEWTQVMAHSLGVIAAFREGHSKLMSRALIDTYAEPARGPLIPDFSEVQNAALAAGALGCTISGGGPTIFAIAEGAKKAEDCLEAMRNALSAPPRLMHVGTIATKGAHPL